MSAAWLTPLRALAEHAPPDLIVCASCEAMRQAPGLGLPDGWDGFYRNGIGWSFTCPACLERTEQDWLNGRSSALGGGLP